MLAADILVLAGPIWLGDNSSVMKQVHERLYGGSQLLNDAGQYLYYGRVGGCLITGNEDGVKHCAQNVLYTLQHIGYTIPPQADAGWIGEAGPGPSYLEPGSGGPENDFTNRNTTFMTWNLMHLARMLRDGGGVPDVRQYPIGMRREMSLRLRESGISLSDTVSVMTETVDETALVAALRDGDKASVRETCRPAHAIDAAGRPRIRSQPRDRRRGGPGDVDRAG